MAISPMLEHFAEELKVARAAAGISQAQLAELLNYSPATIAKIETGERRPSADFAHRCDTVLNTNGLFARIQRQLSREVLVAWFREWAGIEAEASALRGFEPLYVPGLLQTEAYMRAILTGPGLLSAAEVEQQVATRLTRQEVLAGDRPPLLTVVVDEFVLRRRIGGPEVMREQLLQLAKVGESMPRVRIHVVPLSVGPYAGLDGPFVIATPPTGEDIVYVEGQLHAKIFDRPEDLKAAVQLWESIRGEALSHQQSLKLILEVAETWT
ncbi:helix-turn-helix transcriptional regulator [Micromonospora polyrhachis]|uniref:Transcriptional regulator with XRE-family HTH domain n=1 Tax=Micromonospora polyrhachis TaxID=1282883 RepID=A0A7W7SND4_9ACTN|nr:helix-turn-helix transcriptional regulator [Micromonospora polyrhachis]MBB4957611.1 transcriptional regulator with XRE-family HTH domain [Micromonospora polyrhachis]